MRTPNIFKNFLKSKKGEVIEAILVIPIFVIFLIYISYKMQFYETRNSLEDASQVVSRYVMTSNDANTAITTINRYLNSRSDGKYYVECAKDNFDGSEEFNASTMTFTKENFVGVYVYDGNKYTYKTNIDFKNDWVKGNMIEIELKRYAPYYSLTTNKFCPLNAKDYCFELMQATVSTKTVIMLTHTPEETN